MKRHHLTFAILLAALIAFLLIFFSRGAAAAIYRIEGDLIGEVTEYRVEKGENLYAIARAHDIGIVELLSANPGIDPWEPDAGTMLALPTIHVLPDTIREGIVINLSELRLFYFPDGGTVWTFPIGIGKEGWETPTGETTIVRKRENPTWTPPASIREEKPDLPEVVAAGPDNPLGDYAMNLGWAGYVIHGTNRPYGIGKRSSHGCIRLYPEDIETLFGAVEIGTPVTVIDDSYKLGWKGDTLFLEVTPTQAQGDVIAQKYRKPVPRGIPEIYDRVTESIANTIPAEVHIDWYAVETAVRERSGIPAAIATR